MSFIPSKLGLRTHPLTQINLALVRGAGEKIYAEFAALLSDLNCGPSPWARRSNNHQRCVVLLFLSILDSQSSSFISGWKQSNADTSDLSSEETVLGLSSYSCWPGEGPPSPSCNWFRQKTLCAGQTFFFFGCGCFNGRVSELKHTTAYSHLQVNNTNLTNVPFKLHMMCTVYLSFFM